MLRTAAPLQRRVAKKPALAEKEMLSHMRCTAQNEPKPPSKIFASKRLQLDWELVLRHAA